MTPDGMPLLEMSPNIPELELANRKRNHDEFSHLGGEAEAAGTECRLIAPPRSVAAGSPKQEAPVTTRPDGSAPASDSMVPPTATTKTTFEIQLPTSEIPSRDISASLTTMTLSVKRKRLTGSEKEARDKEAAEQKRIRDQQLAEKAAIKASEKAKQDEAKAVRAVEKAKLEEAKAARAKERDEKRKKKEEELQRAQEEKDRKARSQKTLGSFFKIPSTPKKSNGEVSATKESSPVKNDAADPVQRTISAYDAMFKPFFVKENTRLAPILSQMDRATQNSRSRALDGFMSEQGNEAPEFRPLELLGLTGISTHRGHHPRPVKHIMDWAYRESQKTGGAADAKRISDGVQQQLRRVSLKVIAFSQDVRPPYYGTQTLKPFALGKLSMERLARRSMSRRLPLDYDYDSEAEWQEEEGEDVDVDDDEEELDDEDDMDGFLDDSEDTGLARRVFGNAMEPECTGICFENESRVGPNAAIYENKMEFMLGNPTEQWCIDPFSTKYWEPEASSSLLFKPPRTIKSEAETQFVAPQPPANALVALQGAGSSAGPTKLVKAELMNDFKQAILANKALSKVGIIDIIFHQFRNSVSRTEVKNTLEIVAEKKGVGRLKEWELKPGHEIAM